MSLLPSRTSLFDDLFHDMASGFYIRPLHGDPVPGQIKLDLRESGDDYLLQAELPGVAKEDIHVDVHGKKMTVDGKVYGEGAWITLNGTKGVVYEGELKMIDATENELPRANAVFAASRCAVASSFACSACDFSALSSDSIADLPCARSSLASAFCDSRDLARTGSILAR